MNRLIKHSLDKEKAHIHVKHILDNANTLSNEVLKNIDLTKGNFFTLLPPEADLTRIYEFKWGGILPQYPDIPFDENDPSSGTYSAIPTIDFDLALLIEGELEKNSDLVCLFDDVIRYTKEVSHLDFFQNYGLSFGKEVYYLLDVDSAKENLLEAIKKSNAFWHSLCLLTCFKPNENVLNVNEMKRLSRQTLLLFVVAYDSESYVFWEREPDMFWQNLQSK